MSSFTALNIVSDDEESEEELEITQEVQIEEALKLYQTAIKLHAQGAPAFEEAEAAYKELFSSEIFRISNPNLVPASIGTAETALPDNDADSVASADILSVTYEDGPPDAISQLLYLGFKNRAQFAMDRYKHARQHHQTEQDGELPDADDEDPERYARAALDDFIEALVKDETDLDVWRRLARLALYLKRNRLARFALEGVLEEDAEGAPYNPDRPNMEHALAAEDLRALLGLAHDDLSLQQPPFSWIQTKRLDPKIKRLLDPFPFLETPSISVPTGSVVPTSLSPKTVEVAAPTWTAVGRALLHQLVATSHGVIEIDPGASITLKLPEPPLSLENPSPTPIEASIAPAATSHEQTRAETQEKSTLVDGIERSNAKIADSEPISNHPVCVAEDKNGEAATKPLPTRKRSLSSTGVQEGTDGGRLRSKRIKARESVMEAGTEEATSERGPSKLLEEQIRAYTDADESLFESIGTLLRTYNVDMPDTYQDLKHAVAELTKQPSVASSTTAAAQTPIYTALPDLYRLWKRWGEEKAQRSSNKDNVGIMPLDGTSASRNGVIAAFLEQSRGQDKHLHSKLSASDEMGLPEFVQRMNQESNHLKEVGWHWVMHLLFSVPPERMGPGSDHNDPVITMTRYLRDSWAPPLKEAIVQMLVLLDGLLFSSFKTYFRSLEAGEDDAQESSQGLLSGRTTLEVTSMAQTIFELHLDIYASITNPSSEVDICIRLAQRDRLGRWAALTDDLMSLRDEEHDDKHPVDSLDLRYLWASALYAGMAEGASKEHVLLCMTDLRDALRLVGHSAIELQNNAAMPEVSSAAASRELTRLTTKDFFLEVLKGEGGHPVDTIEVLEPILEPFDATADPDPADEQIAREMEEVRDGATKSDQALSSLEARSAHVLEVAAFIKKGAASLRLFLWQRLQDAYKAIDYPPKVMSCYLRSLEVVLEELSSPSHIKCPPDRRQETLWRSLRTLEQLVIGALAMGLDEASAFDCLDERHVQSSLNALAQLCKLLHSHLLFEDPARAAQAQMAQPHPQPNSTQLGSWKTRLRELQLRSWLLFYLLSKEAMSQSQEALQSTVSKRLDFLQRLHQAMGVRHLCDGGNKLLLRFMKVELFALMESGVEDWDQELFQILYDLHGLRLASGNLFPEEHGCSSEPLDRPTATRIVPLVMSLMQHVTIKDIQKPEYKTVMEKMQQAVGLPTLEPTVAYNRRVLDHYFESSINPLELYGCMKGRNELSGVTVPADISRVASTGWYYHLGTTALARFKSQKRVGPGAAEDLDDAARFLTIDLLLGLDRWESWYRLAQVFDLMLEEEVLWTADKLNKERNELRTLQRKAIKCYTMAISSAIRWAEQTSKTLAILSDLYTDFGSRIYASSRPPFRMEVFGVKEFQRHFSGSGGMYIRHSHQELSVQKAWQFAAALFRRALVEKPNSWSDYHKLGKCLWKMVSHAMTAGGEPVFRDDEAMRDLMWVLERAIESLPKRKSDRQEPILEPHYKWVSVVHKLTRCGHFKFDEAYERMQRSSYAAKVSRPELEDEDSWMEYVLQVLKVLRQADKANWHHRMVARSADIIYTMGGGSLEAAAAAKQEFNQQIFTKTMTIQVWKPENERAGRHFCYTTLYTRRFAKFVHQLNDLSTLEVLARRVRKRSSDFFEHARLWEELCYSWVQLLRRSCDTPERHEEAVFKAINTEEFHLRSELLEAWCQAPTNASAAATAHMNVLRDAFELKKINNNLFRGPEIDQLIADTYAVLYELVTPGLRQKVVKEPERRDGPRDMMSVTNLLMSVDGGPDAGRPLEPSTLQGFPFVRQRLKGISRKELLRRAELTVAHLAPVSTTLRPPRASTTVVDKTEDDEGQHAPSGGPVSSEVESGFGSGEEDVGSEGGELEPSVKPLFPNLAAPHEDQRIDGTISDGGTISEAGTISEGENEGEDEGGEETNGQREDSVV
ncbi:MAG: Histone transcription regulator 3 [Caeruleum heppii]|nr:MAG: Histone transcription regulator 3 [Caeruleum heppii]